MTMMMTTVFHRDPRCNGAVSLPVFLVLPLVLFMPFSVSQPTLGASHRRMTKMHPSSLQLRRRFDCSRMMVHTNRIKKSILRVSAEGPVVPRTTRRKSLSGMITAVPLLLSSLSINGGHAALAASDPSEDYITLTRKLVQNLRATLDAEEQGKPPAQVRKVGADAAESSKEWIKKYSGGRGAASKEPEVYKSVASALSLLGQHYQKNGPQAKIPEELISSIKEKLDAAEDALDGLEDAKQAATSPS
mmetsp:Transcript_41589/g.69482  ORF Transcript_41589/g.69482 Transcript_41589/m.69482 type:complete len:246 (+) Transcript_41589:3-740(+)